MRTVLLGALALALVTPADAQTRSVEVGAQVESLSGGYADGRGAYARLTLPRHAGWARLEASVQDRFGEPAVVAGVAAAQDLGPRWVVSGGVGTSTAGLVYPRLQAGLGVSRKWGAGRNVMTTLAAGYRDAHDVHEDLDLTGEVAVYRPSLVLQAGARASLSRPGDALGYAGFVAATIGDPDGARFTGRLGTAREAYLLVDPAPVDVSFRSVEASAGWHQPVGPRWIASVSGGLYANPYYTRLGVQTGVIRRF